MKLRASFSSAGEQFQANRQLSVALKPAVQRRKICKNENNIVKENHARKGTRPCEGVEGSGENRNSPPLFAILAFKMAKAPATPQKSFTNVVKLSICNSLTSYFILYIELRKSKPNLDLINCIFSIDGFLLPCI